MSVRLTAGAAALAWLGCGGAQGGGAAATDADFPCRQRVAEYVVAGGFAAEKLGVTVRCEPGGPQLEKWRLERGASEPVRSIHRLTPAEFESLWEPIEGSGWQQLTECAGADGGPVYAFHIGDHTHDVRLTCTGKELPFPFDRLVTELDAKAAAVD